MDDSKIYRTFVVHKPVGVIAGKSDSRVTNIISRKHDERCGERRGGEPRLTIYELAAMAGFPTDVGLVGRLDCETSGIMVMTDNPYLGNAIKNPVSEEAGTMHLRNSPYKKKEYVMKLLHPRLRDMDLVQLEQDMRQPMNFMHHCKERQTSEAEVEILRRYQDSNLTRGGHAHLGWCVDVRVVIAEGKHHQVRRMAGRHSLKVLSLTRTCIASLLHLSSIPEPGDCRWCTGEEIALLYKHLCVPKSTSLISSRLQ
jgi:16S rRNA U516 pseudouridylate synthase RsuA-like enzyme